VLDLPERVLEKIQYSNSWFTVKAGESVLIDYTGFSQDSDSISQVGKQDDRWQARELRLSLRGTIGSAYKVSYLVTASYNGDADPGQRMSLVDASLSFPIGGPATQLTLGKTKETFDYEVVSSFPNLPQQERVLNPFFVTRNIGAKISQVFANHRMTLSAGLFNDWWMQGNSIRHNGTDGSARLTGLVWDNPDSNRYLHLALAIRYVGGDGNTLRYKGRPESNVSDNYVDTRDLPADHAWQLARKRSGTRDRSRCSPNTIAPGWTRLQWATLNSAATTFSPVGSLPGSRGVTIAPLVTPGASCPKAGGVRPNWWPAFHTWISTMAGYTAASLIKSISA
jgi:hypothetical protein